MNPFSERKNLLHAIKINNTQISGLHIFTTRGSTIQAHLKAMESDVPVTTLHPYCIILILCGIALSNLDQFSALQGKVVELIIRRGIQRKLLLLFSFLLLFLAAGHNPRRTQHGNHSGSQQETCKTLHHITLYCTNGYHKLFNGRKGSAATQHGV